MTTIPVSTGSLGAPAAVAAGAPKSRVLEWFRGHPLAGGLIAFVYYVLVVVSHDLVQRPALALQRTYGVELVHYVLVGVILAITGYIVWRIWNRIRSHHASRRMLWTGIALLVWSAIVLSLFMVRSIETIHYVQYLLLTLVLATMWGNPLLAVLIGTVCGAVDEGWQFFYLHPNQPYYDFNDVVMNTTGVLQGAWFYALFRFSGTVGRSRIRPMLAGWGGLLALVVVLFATETFTVYRQDQGIALHRRVPPTAEKPVVYVRTNGWGNTWVRLHPYVGFRFLFLLPMAMFVLPRPDDEEA